MLGRIYIFSMASLSNIIMKITVVYSVIFFCIMSCNKQLQAQQIDNRDGFGEKVNMEEIKASYAKLIAAENQAQGKGAKKADLRESVIHWQDARLYHDKNIVTIPFSQKKRIYYLQDDSSAISYDNASHFIVTKENGQYKFEVMTKIPDLKYLQNYQEVIDFSGRLIFEDIHGNFTKGYIVDNGIIESSLLKISEKSPSEGLIVNNWYAASDIREVKSMENPSYTEYYAIDKLNTPINHSNFYTLIGEYRPEIKSSYVFPEIKRKFKLVTGY
jgi:hypothetical protein